MKRESVRSTGLLTTTLVLLTFGCGQEPEPDAQNLDATDTTKSLVAAEPEKAPDGRPRGTRVNFDVDARRPATLLSDYGLFEDLAEQTLLEGVIPYQLNSLSFVDGARQESFVYIPPGETARYQPDNAFTFPVGSILIQNLWFPVDADDVSNQKRLFETRLLLHMTKGWTAVPYLWNEEGTDADRVVIGQKSQVTRGPSAGDPHTFTFLTPNMNECKSCHVNEDVMYPIGVTAANLNRTISVEGTDVNQLDYWQRIGLLTGLPDDRSGIPSIPDWTDDASTTVESRARSWLDVNCSHCHNPRGAAQHVWTGPYFHSESAGPLRCLQAAGGSGTRFAGTQVQHSATKARRVVPGSTHDLDGTRCDDASARSLNGRSSGGRIDPPMDLRDGGR